MTVKYDTFSNRLKALLERRKDTLYRQKYNVFYLIKKSKIMENILKAEKFKYISKQVFKGVGIIMLLAYMYRDHFQHKINMENLEKKWGGN